MAGGNAGVGGWELRVLQDTKGHGTEATDDRVGGGFRTLALNVLKNPHLPASDPSFATCLRTKRDKTLAPNTIREGQVHSLKNERTPMMAEGAC